MQLCLDLCSPGHSGHAALTLPCGNYTRAWKDAAYLAINSAVGASDCMSIRCCPYW